MARPGEKLPRGDEDRGRAGAVVPPRVCRRRRWGRKQDLQCMETGCPGIQGTQEAAEGERRLKDDVAVREEEVREGAWSCAEMDGCDI